MNINRHNYEEFFILYMDNELGSDDRRMVEAFVQQHPDLKEELDLLLQFKLEPDNAVVFNGKEDLMKVNGDTPVTLSNYEEWLVLYIDDELTTDQKKNVEQFIAANPSAKKELALLMNTKLQPELVVFDNKASLYRKEEKVHVIPMRWLRLRQAFGDRRWRVAAAILILALGLTALLVFNNKPTAGEKPIVKTAPGLEKKNAPEKKDGPTVKEDIAINPNQSKAPVNETPVTNNTIKQAFTPVEKQENKNIVVKNNKAIVNDNVPANIPTPVKKDDAIVVDNSNKPSNNLPQSLKNPNIKNNDAANKDVAIVNPPDNKQEPKITAPVTTNTTQPSDIVNASFKDDADLNQSGGKKGKFRGFFRKVTRTFEKRTNIDATDNDRFLVAGLAIKLK